MKTTKRKCSLRMADGGIVAPSPFSLRGISQGLAGGYSALVDGAASGMEAAQRTFGRPPGYTAAPQTANGAAPPTMSAPAAPAAPTQPAPTVGGAIGAIQQNQQMLHNLRDGTPFLRGPGGPTDDKIPAKLSRGEAVLPADTVAKVGPHNVQNLIDSTHTPTGRVNMRAHFADGGFPGIDVNERPWVASDNAAFPNSPQAAAEAAHAARVNPAPPPSNYTSPGYADHFAPPPEVPASPAGAAEASTGRLAGVRNFLAGAGESGGDVLGAARSVGGGLARGALTTARSMAPALGLGAAAEGAVTGLRTGTDEYAKRFGMEDTEPGVMRDLGLRTLGVASDIGNALTFGQAQRLYRDKQGAEVPSAAPVVPPAAAPAVTAPGAAPSVSPAASPGDLKADESYAQSPNVSAPDAGNVQRRGNSFTNTGTFIEDQRPTTGSISAQNSGAADALSAKYAGLRGGFTGTDTPNLPAGFGSTIPGQNGVPASQYETELAARNAGVRSNLGGAGGAISPRTQATMDAARMQHEATLRGQDIGANVTSRGQDLNYASAREGNKVSMRGQDLGFESSMFGHQITGAGNRARLQYEMGKDQFDRNMRTAEFGQHQDQQTFSQREQADKDLTSKLEAQNTTKDDKGNSVVDHDAVASTKNAVMNHIGNTIASLEKIPTSSPDYQHAQKMAKQLRDKGPAAVGDDALSRIVAQEEVSRRAAAAKGYGPFSGTYVDSPDPSAYDITGVKRGLLQDQYVTRNGSQIPTRALDYDKGGNAILPNILGNNRTQRFDIIKKDLHDGF